MRFGPRCSSFIIQMVSFSFVQNAYIVHELYFEIPACIKWVITEVLTDVDDAHTHTHRERTDLLLSRGGVSREQQTTARSRGPVVSDDRRCVGGFRLMSLGTTREERLHRRFSCSCGFLRESTQSTIFLRAFRRVSRART